MTKRQALVAVINMAKVVQLDHTYAGCKFHNKYQRQRRAIKIVEGLLRGIETKDSWMFRNYHKGE
jgi:hypothetical protein